ncbi:hypothetical protein [Microbacterium murale]|uniref:Lipoprotein n=1 Tax=Microbacterium murale TaxID=1081040 RepID=A0ABU0P996_9MICO|nr:hypothetical protein [Microbacterium murale]MDQ0643918.1 hypothetical protein [Microbacterium murale]
MRKRRTPLAVAGAAGVAVVLAGCGNIDAGSWAEELFVEHMAATPGVLQASGSMSNDLPFQGSGDLAVELDSRSDVDVLDAALEHALEFDVPSTVSVKWLIVEFSEGFDTPGDAPADGASITIEMPWSGESDGIIDRALALSMINGLRSYQEEQEYVPGDGYEVVTTVVVDAQIDPCPVLELVGGVSGVDDAALEEFQQATRASTSHLIRSEICAAAP